MADFTQIANYSLAYQNNLGVGGTGVGDRFPAKSFRHRLMT